MISPQPTMLRIDLSICLQISGLGTWHVERHSPKWAGIWSAPLRVDKDQAAVLTIFLMNDENCKSVAERAGAARFLNATIVPAHQHAAGAPKGKRGGCPGHGWSRGGLSTKIHAASAALRAATDVRRHQKKADSGTVLVYADARCRSTGLLQLVHE
jgi:hypothetical protein